MLSLLKLEWPIVREFHGAAWRHFESAEVLISSCSPNSNSARAAEGIYLGGYVVECILKAVLFSRTKLARHKALEKECIQEIQHDLEKLKLRLERLRKHPITLPLVQARQLRFVRNLWHPRMRYINRTWVAEDARDFLMASEGILKFACGEGER